ncbi:MAG: hypothetical protein JWM32_1468 [Verrucomicrobia bacterium]|nr:hypothetical protein [Verrucomicrobiota bacterium]
MIVSAVMTLARGQTTPSANHPTQTTLQSEITAELQADAKNLNHASTFSPILRDPITSALFPVQAPRFNDPFPTAITAPDSSFLTTGTLYHQLARKTPTNLSLQLSNGPQGFGFVHSGLTFLR